MGWDAGVQIEGAKQLRKSLKAAGDDLTDLKAAHAEAATIVATAGQAGAPSVTGLLAASVRGAGTKTAAIVRAGKAAVPYANPIHWGWFRHHINPNPWLTRAAQSTESRWIGTYNTAVQTMLDKIEGM